MSNYGNPPQDPYGQQPPPSDPYGQQPPPSDPYGQQPPQQNPYGQQPYGGQPTQGQPAYGAPAPYAHWVKRVGALVIDWLAMAVAALPLWIGYGILIATSEFQTDPDTGVVTTTEGGSPIGVVLVLIGILTYLAFAIWNIFIKQGRTGYTVGKGVLGIKLISEATGQPIGAGMAFVRQIAHILDGICFLGYAWPLWDPKRQTFADKILGTVVIDQPKG